MLHLQVLRHAKSDWDAAASDHGRPLNRRGERSADRLGELLADIDEVPDHAITSSATRARTTLLRAVSAGAWHTSADETDDLYSTTVAGALGVIASAPAVERLMVVGHEPTWSSLVQHLTNGAVAVKTATVIGIDVHADAWSDIARARCEIAYVLRARHFLDD